MDGFYGSSIYAFSLDGDQRFAVGLAATTSHEPAIGSDGTIYAPRFIGLAVAAFDPGDGSTLWEYNGGWATGVEDIEIGPDDTLYFVGGVGHLEAFNPHTQSQLWRNSTGMVLDRPTVSPDGSVLVLSGVPNYGDPGFVKGYNPSNGNELWTVDLPGEPYPGFRVLGTDHPRITPDSATAYVSTLTVADGSPAADPRSYLFAIEIGEGTARPGDIDGDGVVGINDLLILLAAWGACPPPCPQCPADLDDNCTVGINDLLILLANWGA
jgi:outer membrane protein assembly factor BamB